MAITHSSGTITIDSGRTNSTATSAGTATLTDSGQSWTTNAEAGYVVWIYGGTGAGQYGLIASNTATQLTISRSWEANFSTGAIDVTSSDWGTALDNTSQYVILYRWSDVQAADTTGGWGVCTTQGNQINIAGDIQWGGGTNYGGLWDYNIYVDVQFPSASGYQVDRWLMSNNCLWGDGLPDDNGEPTEGGLYNFDCANLNTTGVDLVNGAFTGSNYNCYIWMLDTTWKSVTYSTPQSWIFYRPKSNTVECIHMGFKSSNGPAGRWASDNTIVDTVVLHDCINDWAITGSPTSPARNVVVFNADAGAQVSDPGAEYDGWIWYNNNDVISMGGFTTGNNFYITDSYYARDRSVGLLTVSDISCSSSLGNAAAAGALYERNRISYNIVDSSGTAINGARVYLENTSGTQQINEITDSNGDTTVNLVNKQLWQGSSNPGVNNVPPNAATVYNPMTLRVRDYDYNFLEETFTLEFPITAQSKALADNSFVSASQATAAAYTGISVNHSTGVVTITEDHTIQELYDYHVNDLCASANIQYDDWLTTADGVNFTSTYDITITGSGIELTGLSNTITMSGATLTTASGGFYEDANGAQWEAGGSVYYASHFFHRVLISGTSTAIQNAVVGYYASGTNYTYNTSLSNTTLTSDASGDVEGYVVYQIDASPVTGHSLLCREYDYDLFSSPASPDGNPIGASGSAISISLVADSNVSASRATASAYSGITINHGSSTLGIATSDRTVQELYDYNKYNITLAANFDQSEWLTTADGINYTVGYATTITGVDLTDESASLTFSVSLTVASGGFFEDSNGARWESGASTYYATHIRHRVVISGTSTAIQNAVVAYYETDTNTNVTYNTSLSAGALTTDASGDIEGYAVYRIDAATYGGHNLLVREYDYNLFSSPATVDGNPIGSSGSPNRVSLVTDSFVSASRATAAAYTGITINHGTPSLAIATSARTIQELYDYTKYDITLAANFAYSQWFTTVDGSTFTTTYNTTVTGVNFTGLSNTFALSSATLTLASGGFFEDSTRAQWESGGSIYYASHFYIEANLDGTATSIQNAVVSFFETDTDTNVTYNTSLTQTGLISDANGQVEGYAVYRVDSTTYGGHNLLIGSYDHQWVNIPISVNGTPIGSSGAYSIYFMRTDSNVTDTRTNALAVSGVTVTYGSNLVVTTAAASDTYDNLKARQTRYTDIDTGTPGVDSYYEVSLYNGGDGHILAHSGTAHVLADTWDFSIASDYGYPLSFDSSTLSLTATGTYQDLTFTGNSTLEFEAIGTYTLSTNITLTGSTTFDNLTAGTVNVTMAPGATTPTLANTGGGGNPVISNALTVDVDAPNLVDGTRVRLYNTTAAGVSAWQASTAYSLGDRVLRTTGLGSELNGGVYFICTVAGTSGGSEPTWDVAAAGNTTTDNTVTWTVYPVEIDNSTVSGGSGYSYTVTADQDYVQGDTITIYYAYQSGTTAYLSDSNATVVNASNVSFVDTQSNDTVYNTNAIDGSGVTEFSTDFANIEIDINDPNNETSIERIYAWYIYILQTANGIRNWFGGIEAEDIANYVINTSIVDLLLDNTGSAGLVLTSAQGEVGARLYRDDGTSIWASTSNAASSDFGRVFIAETGTSGLTASESSQLAALGTPSENAAALLDTDITSHTTAQTVGKTLIDAKNYSLLNFVTKK